jgi:hypothetical protein
MNKITRKYNTSDVNMIVATSAIIESAITNKKFLQENRSTWGDPFFQDIKTKIDQATQEYLGVDNAKQLREATQVVTKIQADAISKLSLSKTQITEDFKKDKTQQDEILTQLGFKAHGVDAIKGNQEALINLLYQFKKNLTPDLKTEIIAKGTAPKTLESIIEYADTLINANIKQENNKGSRKEITNEVITVFNDIYDAVVSIARISNKLYKDNPALQQQFSFAKVTRGLTVAKKKVAKP